MNNIKQNKTEENVDCYKWSAYIINVRTRLRSMFKYLYVRVLDKH